MDTALNATSISSCQPAEETRAPIVADPSSLVPGEIGGSDTQQGLEDKYPLAWRQYKAIAKMVYYVNLQALEELSVLVRRSNVPKYQWNRIESCFLNRYGLKRWKNKLFVQEELVEDKATGLWKRDGIAELTQDFLDILNDDLKEDKDKLITFLEKYERIGRDLQREVGIEYRPGDDVDDTGQLRILEDYTEEERRRILGGRKSEFKKVEGSGGIHGGDKPGDEGELADQHLPDAPGEPQAQTGEVGAESAN